MMSHKPNKIILSSVYSGTVMHVESMTDRSKRKVRRQQNYIRLLAVRGHSRPRHYLISNAVYGGNYFELFFTSIRINSQ